MKAKTLVLAACTIGLCFATAFAQDAPPAKQNQTKTPFINARQHNQQRRIKQGVKSGELSKGETRRLEREQGKIQADKMQAKADGKVTSAERQKIRREQNKASRDIYRLKHNERKRN